MRVPRPGTFTLIMRGSLKRKSNAHTSALSSFEGADFTSRSLKVSWLTAGADSAKSRGAASSNAGHNRCDVFDMRESSGNVPERAHRLVYFDVHDNAPRAARSSRRNRFVYGARWRDHRLDE